MKREIKVLMAFLVAVSILFTTMTQKLSAEEVDVSARLNGKGYVAPQSLGEAVNDTTTLTSAVYDEIDGVLYAYSMTNGGYFNVVNLVSNELVYSEYVAGVSQAWGHTVTDDHVVYMAALGPNNDGWLLRYNPEIGKVEDLGRPFPGYQFWSITSDGKDNVFIGTFKEKEAIVIQYNIASGEYENLGVVGADKELGYVRSIAYHDQKLYLGMGVKAAVYQLDLETKELTDITGNAYDLIDKPGNKEDIKYVYDLGVVKNHLVARFDHDGMGAILLYNLVENKWEDKVLKKTTDDTFGAFGWNQLVNNDGVTYISFERQLHEINTNTLEDRAIGGAVFGHRGGALYDFGEGLEFVTSERLGSTLKINVENGQRSSLQNVMRGSAMKLHNLGKDTKGDLYVTTYPGGPKGAKYSMQEEKYTSYPQGQAEGIVAGEDNEMYFGIYPGASIQRMNTETFEIETLFDLKTTHEQDRPYIMKYEDGLLLIGTIPDYQKVGGTLSIYNPQTGDLQTHRNVVENQSIVGLAKKGNLIFGSTTTKGGLDAPIITDKPKIFVWDIEAQSKIKEIELNLPGLNETPMISGLSFDDKGMLWGAVDGFLFTLNPETYEIENYKNIYPNVGNRGMWRPVHIEFGDDGFVYSDVAGKLTVVDPSTDTWEHTTIPTAKEVDFMTLSHDKNGQQNIYIVQADPTEIEVVEIVDVDPTIEEDKTITAKVLKDGKNFDFEDKVENKTIPGWSSLFENVTENVGFEISTEKVHSGNQSLKLVDNSDAETVFVISDPIDVVEDEVYTMEAMLYLEDGMNTIVLRYYDDNGVQVNQDIDGVNIIHVRSGYKEWRKISATVTVPAGATNARISLGSSKYFVTSGAYYDDIKLYSEQNVETLKFKKLEQVIDEFDELDASLYKKESYQDALSTRNEAEEVIDIAQQEELAMIDGISEADFNQRVLQSDIDTLVFKLEEKIEKLEILKDEETPKEEEEEKPEEGKEKEDSDDKKESKETPGTGLNINASVYGVITVISLLAIVVLKRLKFNK